MSEQNEFLKTAKPFLKYGGSLVAVIIGAVFASSMFYSVDAGSTAIVTRYGEITDVKQSGLNFKTPMDTVHYFSTREQKQDFGTFSEKTGDIVSGLSAYTADRQTAYAALSITYQVNDPQTVYTKYRTTENMINNILAPRVRQQLEIVFSKYTSETVIKNRGEFSSQLKQAIVGSLEGQPIVVNDVQSVINFSKEWEAKIEAAVNADIEIRNAERETKVAQEQARKALAIAEGAANAELAKAKAEAEKRVLEADAEAHAIKVRGDAEAQATKALTDALEKNNNLVALETAKRWDGKLPTYLPNGTVMPFITLPNVPAGK